MTEHISIEEYLKQIKKGRQGGRQVAQGQRKHKFNATPVKDIRTGVKYASKKEAKRATELRLMQRQGLIIDLKEQPRFPFVANDRMPQSITYDSGRICTYVADFQYKDLDGEIHYEDVKGFITPMYKIKKALLWAYYGIVVKEV